MNDTIMNGENIIKQKDFFKGNTSLLWWLWC